MANLKSERPFNAINGQELLTVIEHDVVELFRKNLRSYLTRFSEFRGHLTYPQVAYNVAISIDYFPRPEGPPVEVRVEGMVKSDTSDEGKAAPMAVRVPKAPSTDEPDPLTSGHLQQAVLGTRQADPAAIRTPESVQGDDSRTVRGVPHTQTGIEMEVGVLPPNAAVQAMTDAHRKAHAAEMGAEDARTGRTITNPDEARRETGQPVPRPTPVGGGMVVDVPTREAEDQF